MCFDCRSFCAFLAGENKFCAMMVCIFFFQLAFRESNRQHKNSQDVLEEMDHRYNIKPNAESWTYLLKDLVLSGDFRLGWVCIAGMKSMKIEPPADLVAVCLQYQVADFFHCRFSFSV